MELAYKSKYTFKRKKQIILLVIRNKNIRWHYLAVKSLFRGITSNHYGDFYCLKCFHSYRTLNKLKRHERVCNNHDYCCIDMPKEHDLHDILTWRKVIKSSVYSLCRFRTLLERIPPCQNNPENSHTEEKAKHKPSGYSWSPICLFGDTKNKHHFYRGNDCIEKFCKDLKEL